MDTILILDSDPIITERLVKSLERDYHVCCCQDHQELIDFATECKPAVMVVDLSIAGEQTVALLQTLYMSGFRAPIIASSTYWSAYAVDRMVQLGARSLIARPCTANAILRGVMDAVLPDKTPDCDRRRCINDLLLNLGFRMDLQGYRYIPDLVSYIIEHPNCMITTQLYPDVAKLYNANDKQVEKTVRDCINATWENRDVRIWKLYFPERVCKQRDCVSNGVFLKRIAYAIADYMGYTQSKTGTDL